MKTNNIELRFRLSVAAHRVFNLVASKQDLALVIDVFKDALLYGDIEDFCEAPEFYFDAYGRQKVKRVQQRFTFRKCIAKVDLHTIKKIRTLQRIGFSLSWIFEEALFYAYSQKILKPALKQVA